MKTLIVYSARTGEPIAAIRVKDHELQALREGAMMVIPVAIDRTPMLVMNNRMDLLHTPAWKHLTLAPRNAAEVEWPLYLVCNDDELARGLPSVLLPGQADPKPWP